MPLTATAMSHHTDIDNLWSNDEDSFEVKVPDFHFDWGVGIDNPASTKQEQDVQDENKKQIVTNRLASLSLSNPSIINGRHSPAHSATPPPRHSQSARSSLSSAHVTSLTDASTASASSLVPTPPIAGPSSFQSAQPTSAEGVSGGSGRIYGGSRRFQRVVSAPISRRRYDDDDGASNGETSTMSASTSHTATLRPTLTHTASGSIVPTETARFTTPGITDRTLTSRSTGRRLGGLSKFGGPARRVVPAQEEEEGSPVLMDSPGRDQRSAAAVDPDQPTHRSPQISDVPPYPSTHKPHPSTSSEAGRSALRTDLEPLAERPEPSRFDRYRLRSTSPATDEPFRPFGQQWEPQRPNPPRSVEDAANVPSRVTQIPSREPQPSEQMPLRAERPAPVLTDARRPTETQTTAPLTAPALVQQSAMDMPQPLPHLPQQGRTSYLVNGVPYERLQRLGKGGSSTVYSVLFSAPPKKRIIYALKVVQLERADSETYQSYTNEIDLLKRLRGHDRVIQLIDHQITFSQPNRPHRLMMVMECGEIDFAALLDEQRGKAINMNFVGLYWEQMLEAVQAVHQENVVHTDLKPANFVLVKGRLKIIDFGIAKAVANDTVNIQRDQQIGTVNYMSPEAIQRMNNQKVLKLSYPSDVWSLGCILYQMIYGSPPFQHINGGPLAKMGVIADPTHTIAYPEMAIPKTAVGVGLDGQPLDPNSLAVAVSPAAIDSMQRCLAYRKEHRLTIPELLHHEFLKPKIRAPPLPPGSTPITQHQMGQLVNFVLREQGLPQLQEGNLTAEDLFTQLAAQNALSR